MTGLIAAITLTACAFGLGAWIGARRSVQLIGKYALECIEQAKSKERQIARAEAYRDLFLAMGAKPSANQTPKD